MLMLKYRNQKGFSIIEVLIVLAIAGLIMLVVFLAVPALRRNAANSGRQNDASRVSSAVQDCLSNRNGKNSSCNTAATIDVGDLSQLDSTTFAFKNYTGSPAADTVAASATSPFYYPFTVNTEATNATVIYSAKCSPSGDGAVSSSNTRDFVVLYGKKGTSSNATVCIGS